MTAARKALLETERRVLYGLVRYPGSTDKQLSAQVRLKVPTVTSIRLKLARGGYFKTVRVPAFNRLGCELLSASLLTFSAHPPLEQKVRLVSSVLRRPEFVFGISEANQDLFLQIGADLTTVRRNTEDLEGALKSIGYLEAPISMIQFPFSLSSVPIYFDYANLLQHTFWPDQPLDVRTDPLPFEPGPPAALSDKDQEVLGGLVRYPACHDLELSTRIPASRMTIGRTKKRLARERLFALRTIPNLEYLGFEVLLVTHGWFNHTLSEGLKSYVPELVRTIGPPIFAAYGKNELLFINAFEDFARYKAAYAHFTEAYTINEIFARPPDRAIFSLRDLVTPKNHEYGDLTEALSVPTPVRTDARGKPRSSAQA